MVPPKTSSSNNPLLSPVVKFSVGIVLITLAIFVVVPTSNTNNEAAYDAAFDSSSGLRDGPDGSASSSKSIQTKSSSDSKIVQGTIQSVDYYHCAASQSSVETGTVKDIVLLHGSKFTKEHWKSSGILDLLCKSDHVAVTALDLDVKARYDTLVPLLKEMSQERLLTNTPIDALVTPSASGTAVSSALKDGQISQIKKLVDLWVPVASGSVLNIPTEQVQSAQKVGLKILAMHGDKDRGGKQVSAKLEKEAGAVVMEFPGPHPFYLDVPREFSEALLKYLG